MKLRPIWACVVNPVFCCLFYTDNVLSLGKVKTGTHRDFAVDWKSEWENGIKYGFIFILLWYRHFIYLSRFTSMTWVEMMKSRNIFPFISLLFWPLLPFLSFALSISSSTCRLNCASYLVTRGVFSYPPTIMTLFHTPGLVRFQFFTTHTRTHTPATPLLLS